MTIRTKTPSTVDAVGDPEPIITLGLCWKVYRRENGGPTVDFNIRAPNKTDGPEQYAMGEEAKIEATGAPFQPNETVGYIETLSGSASFAQREE